MARRASSSVDPWWIILAAGILLIALLGGYLLFGSGKEGGPYRTMTALPVGEYLENSNSYRGNNYKVEGTISKQLEYSPVNGWLFAVEVGSDLIPILVPLDLGRNVERGQKFDFKIEVVDKGILRAKELKKK
ncbi:MAG: hypothetical protein NTX04_08650 [Verrucomicrobia bacterium]|nr:hypothetical protein [Verrucomicrobiota bacterium]